VNSSSRGARGKAEVVCFKCNQKGHKAPDCPTRPKTNRRVKLPVDKLVYLNPNELFGQVGVHGMPITCDSGAQISVVPEECVEPSEFSGELQVLEDFHTGRVTGRVCHVNFKIGGRTFRKRAVTQPGELLRWTPCMAVPLNPRDEMDFILSQIGEKEAACREDSRYLPPTFQNGMLISGLMAVDGEVVKECKVAREVTDSDVSVSNKCEARQHVTSGDSNESVEQAMLDLARIEIEGEDKRSNNNMEEDIGDHGKMEEAERDERSYVSEEVEGESLEGSAVAEDQLVCETMGAGIPREALAKATAEGPGNWLKRRGRDTGTTMVSF